MLTNRKTQFIGMVLLIVVAAFITISAMRVPAPADLSWPPRPDFSILNQKAIVPLTGNQASSDYALRHPELSKGAEAMVDKSDYALRHPELSKGAEAMVDTSDYALRHPELFQSTGAIDTSDYYLRHK